MKKLFLSLAATMLATAVTYAQNSLLATLSHEGEISTYYGAVALRDAYNAASHGDIITLSSGTFLATNIEKAVTVRGAGMMPDTVNNILPTILSGDFTINIPDSIESRLTMEGIYHNNTITVSNLSNATFLKNRLAKVTPSNNTTSRMRNLTFIHCFVAGNFGLSNESSASCINCYIGNPYSYSGSTSNFEFINCVCVKKDYYLSDVRTSSFINSIIYGYYGGSDMKLAASCSAFYCVGKGWNGLFGNIPNTTNTEITVGLSTLFKTYDGTYNDNETFELTDEAKTKYLGSDGTQVGIYGGNLPFSVTPTNPQITKCNVAAKSTADGKLSVDIQVSAAE